MFCGDITDKKNFILVLLLSGAMQAMEFSPYNMGNEEIFDY